MSAHCGSRHPGCTTSRLMEAPSGLRGDTQINQTQRTMRFQAGMGISRKEATQGGVSESANDGAGWVLGHRVPFGGRRLSAAVSVRDAEKELNAPFVLSSSSWGTEFRGCRLVTRPRVIREALDNVGFKTFATPELYVA